MSRERSFPGHDAQAEHVRVLFQGPLGPPAPLGSRVEPRGGRAEQNRAPRGAQAVPGGEALFTKMGDVHAEGRARSRGASEPGSCVGHARLARRQRKGRTRRARMGGSKCRSVP
jgi:hypothetical protein